jgi:Spy/CpxP family protein refolding chaperone
MSAKIAKLTLGLLAAAGIAGAQSSAAMERTLQPGVSGNWWTRDEIAQRLGLTPEQRKNMDATFQQSRLKLIDLTAALDKEEVQLEPLVDAEQPDAAKIRAQIERIAQARAELEKANANMLLGIRLALTAEQWHELRTHGIGPRARRLQGSGPTPRKVQ